MKVGDKIRVPSHWGNTIIGWTDYTVEEFRFCLGIFVDEEHRKAGEFTPLCEMYEPGPESEEGYISNYGPYYTNMVPVWGDIPE